MADFVPLFAHPRLTADAYGRAVSRYFEAGIDVPIIIFADPTGREIPGTRLDHVKAQVKANVLASARKALDSFRSGEPPAKVRERWADFGRALRLRGEAMDSGAGVGILVRLRDGSPAGSPLRLSVEEYLSRLDRDEASGVVDVAVMDLEGDDAASGLEALFRVLRDYPGLPSAAKAKALLEKARDDAARAEAFRAAEREHQAWLALRDADRLARDGKTKEAAEARARVAKEFEGTAAAAEAAKR